MWGEILTFSNNVDHNGSYSVVIKIAPKHEKFAEISNAVRLIIESMGYLAYAYDCPDSTPDNESQTTLLDILGSCFKFILPDTPSKWIFFLNNETTDDELKNIKNDFYTEFAKYEFGT